MGSINHNGGVVRILTYYLVLASLWIVLSDRILTVTAPLNLSQAALQSSKGLAFVLLTTLGLGLILRRESLRTASAQTLARENDARGQSLIDTSFFQAADPIPSTQLGARQALFDLNLSTGELVSSTECAEILDVEPNEVPRHASDWLACLHTEDRQRIADQLSHLTSDPSGTLCAEYRHATRTGDYRWIRSRGRIVNHPDGTAWRLVGIHTEVTAEKVLESTLAQRESTLRLFIDHAPAAVAMFDREMRYITASRRWIEDYQLTTDVIGKSHYEVFPDLPRPWHEAHQRALQGEVLSSQEDRFVNQLGLEQWLRWEVRPWFTSEGSIGGIVIFTEDITSQKLLHDQLTLYSSVFTQAHEAIAITDRNATIIDVNTAFTKITGYAREEVIGQSPRILRSGIQDVDYYRDMWAELDQSGRWYGEIWNRRKNGEVYPEFLTISTVSDDSGAITNYVGHFFDLSKEKHFEQALRSTEHSLASITNSMQDIVFTLDTQQRHTGVFGPWVSSFGLKPEFFLGKTSREILGERDAAPHIEANRRALAGESIVYEWQISTCSGERYFQTSLSPMFSDEGIVNGVVGVGRDITDLKDAERRTEIQLERLSALRAVDMAISGTFDLSMTLKLILAQVVEQLDVQASSILLLNQHSKTLSYAAGRGFRTNAIEQTRLRLGEGIAGTALLDGRRLRQKDPVHSLYFSRSELLGREMFHDYYAVPMIAKGHMIGVLEVFLDKEQEPSGDWLEFLDTLTDLAAIAVDNARLFGELQRSHLDVVLAYDATIEGWSKALDFRDKETEGHAQRVTELTERLARMAGVSDYEVLQMRRGALLHDIGKMGVPDSILLKEGPLTDEERKIIQTHPDLAYQMLSPIEFLRPALDIPYCHHEKWDGTGYPRGLRGEEIPLAARLFAVIDVWDALRSDRPYRKAWPRSRVLDHIRELSGSHFDPKSVELFLRMMEEDGEEIETVLGYVNFAA